MSDMQSSSRRSGGVPAQADGLGAKPSACSRCWAGGETWPLREWHHGSGSIDDDQLAAHVLVAAAAEDVTLEWEASGLVRHDTDARCRSRLDVRADTELAELEAVV